MKKNIFRTLILFLLISMMSFGIENRKNKEFGSNGSLEFGQTFYGNAGKYKTETSHPMVVFTYNFTPDWSFALQWDRTWNMYTFNNNAESSYYYTHENNSFSKPQITLTHNHGIIEGTKIKCISSLNAEFQNEYAGSHQIYILAQTVFDFSEYIPKGKYIYANQFAISPMYNYGYNTKGPSGHYSSAILSLLTNWQLPANFTFTVNAYGFKEWYNGTYEISDENREYGDATYFMLMTWLEYSKEIYKFNENTTLLFNFAGGLDPYIVSNKKANWNPWIVSNRMYEWLSPTVDLGDYKNSTIVFALPFLQLNYEYNSDLKFNVFAGVKYSNQVWGSVEKDWKLQPQGGLGLLYKF